MPPENLRRCAAKTCLIVRRGQTGEQKETHVIDKISPSLQAALADVHDGATVMIDVTPDGLLVLEMVDGLSLDELQRISGVPLRVATSAAAA